nr:MAG TPA: hypothetical protein [Caudoviricetes sp.]
MILVYQVTKDRQEYKILLDRLLHNKYKPILYHLDMVHQKHVLEILYHQILR